MLWEVDIHPAEGRTDLTAQQILHDARDLGIGGPWRLAAARGYLIQGDFSADQIERLAVELLADPVVERFTAAPAGDPRLLVPPQPGMTPIYVLPKPGVMDPVALSTQAALQDFGGQAEAVRTFRKYWVAGLGEDELAKLCGKILANDAVEQVIRGKLPFDRIEQGEPYRFRLITVPLRDMDDATPGRRGAEPWARPPASAHTLRRSPA
ncbi:MAG: hypothetical protein GYA33_08810 [Thermogutta sp.]|nr:hypothetical protein [Thermogutta sp.]